MKRKAPRAVAAALIVKDGKYLMTRETRAKGRVRWLIPGGGIEFGESASEAAVREVREELGLDIKLGDFIDYYESVHPEVDYHSIIFFYYATASQDDIVLEDGILEARYFTPAEIRELELIVSAKHIFKKLGILSPEYKVEI